jgi:hypothetical protein
MLREKTMREVAKAGADRRPEGVSHLLDVDTASAPQYAANYDDDRDEWGGPKGVCASTSTSSLRASRRATEGARSPGVPAL